MKIKDLLEEIERCRKKYGEDFLEWDIYTEQLSEGDKEHKRKPAPPPDRDDIITLKDLIDAGYGQGWKIVGGHTDNPDDWDDWEYFHCAGFNTIIPQKRIFTINVNF